MKLKVSRVSLEYKRKEETSNNSTYKFKTNILVSVPSLRMKLYCIASLNVYQSNWTSYRNPYDCYILQENANEGSYAQLLKDETLKPFKVRDDIADQL